MVTELVIAGELAIAGLFGLLAGSFLNVCIYRLPRDLSVVAPRSFCPDCGRAVAWYDNIPLVSYLVLGGRCRHCHRRISPRYPLVELLTAVAFASAAGQYGWTPAAVRLAVFSALLIVLFFTDLEMLIIPDQVTLGGTAVGWLLALWAPAPAGIVSLLLPLDRLPAGESLADAVVGGVLPALCLWGIGELYLRVRGREGLGFGDVKMLLLVGAFLGLERTMVTILGASIAGSLVGLALLITRGRRAALVELPFGSFLAATGLYVAHSGFDGRLY